MISQYGVSIKKVHSLHINLWYLTVVFLLRKCTHFTQIYNITMWCFYWEKALTSHKSIISQYGASIRNWIIFNFKNIMNYTYFPKTGNYSSDLTWNWEWWGPWTISSINTLLSLVQRGYMWSNAGLLLEEVSFSNMKLKNMGGGWNEIWQNMVKKFPRLLSLQNRKLFKLLEIK